MTDIRTMTPADADAVRQIEALAFDDWWRQARDPSTHLSPRTRLNILTILAKDPEGCFVALKDDRIVGFIFSRTWGGVGWFGTFAVLPEFQGCGVGKALIAASLDYLRKDANRVIGLDTMAESPNNVGFYLRRGFQVRFPTLFLAKALNQPAHDDLELSRWSQAAPEQRGQWLHDLRQATAGLKPGLDYSKEILSVHEHHLGDTLVYTQAGKAVGMSILWLTNLREGTEDQNAYVHVLALHPAVTNPESYRALLEASQALAGAIGKKTLLIPINSGHTWAVQKAQEFGYRVARMSIHMVLAGTDTGPAADALVDCSRWAG